MCKRCRSNNRSSQRRMGWKHHRGLHRSNLWVAATGLVVAATGLVVAATGLVVTGLVVAVVEGMDSVEAEAMAAIAGTTQ